MKRSSDRLNLLIVSPHLPYPPTWGFGVRVYNLIKHLARRHAVTLLAYQQARETADLSLLKQLCTLHLVPAPNDHGSAKRRGQLASLGSRHSYRVEGLRSTEMARAFASLTRSTPFDVVQIESSPMAWFDSIPSIFVIDEHNIEYELLDRMQRSERSIVRRLYNRAEFLKLQAEERHAWRRASGVAVTSEREQDEVTRFAPTQPTTVVPNGVDLDYFSPALTGDGSSIVFAGALNYRPNVDAVLYFAREVLPLLLRAHPDAHLTVVGGSAPPEVAALHGPAITLTGLVQDVRPYLRAATAVVVPLRMGGGTRLKILEALAMAKPVVSTSIGAEGIHLEDGEHLLIADAPVSFAEQLSRILSDRKLRERLGWQGRSLVEREYGWQSASERLESLYRSLPGLVQRVA